jgi:hypothetical protein
MECVVPQRPLERPAPKAPFDVASLAHL